MQRPFFHKLIVSTTIRDRQLRIPEKFIKKCRDELYSAVTLSVPDGNIWRIGLKKADNKIWLHDSWQEFIQNYSIRVGYFLVFRYEGNSAFSVYIYNLSNSEINYHNILCATEVSRNHKHYYNLFEELEDDESSEVFGSSSPIQTLDSNKILDEHVDQLTQRKSPNTPALRNWFNGSKAQNSVNVACADNLDFSTGVDMKAGIFNTVPEFNRSRAAGIPLDLKRPEKQSKKKTTGKRRKIDPNDQEPSPLGEGEAETRFRFYESASERKRTVTAEEREQALTAAKSFEPPNPFCRVVLRPSYLYRGCIMYLPSSFAEKNLSGISGFIKLQLPSGKQWPVRCLYKGGRAKLSQGWYEFCLENNLEEGDVCIFELLNRNDIVLQITAFRVLEESRLMNKPFQPNMSIMKQIRN